MPAHIDLLRGVMRNNSLIPNLLPVSRWIDSVALAAGVAEDYTLPTDADGHKGTILSISATAGPLYLNFAAAAAVMASDITDGSGSIMLRTDAGGAYIVAVPPAATVLSFICAGTAVVCIEVFR